MFGFSNLNQKKGFLMNIAPIRQINFLKPNIIKPAKNLCYSIPKLKYDSVSFGSDSEKHLPIYSYTDVSVPANMKNL